MSHSRQPACHRTPKLADSGLYQGFGGLSLTIQGDLSSHWAPRKHSVKWSVCLWCRWIMTQLDPTLLNKEAPVPHHSPNFTIFFLFLFEQPLKPNQELWLVALKLTIAFWLGWYVVIYSYHALNMTQKNSKHLQTAHVFFFLFKRIKSYQNTVCILNAVYKTNWHCSIGRTAINVSVALPSKTIALHPYWHLNICCYKIHFPLF